ncbi:MAG: hypothetical protein M3R36_05650 [Bacteroidota bacterium]|nr:hypothetical protein [Bacteroidota bacterium]
MKRVLLIFMLVFIFQSCIKNYPVSPPTTSQLNGKWNISINLNTGILDLQTVNNLLSGSATFNILPALYTLNGSFNDTTLNFNFRVHLSFGESIWKFTGQYDLSNLSMVGLLNIYKYSNDSLAYADWTWFATKDTTAVSFR